MGVGALAGWYSNGIQKGTNPFWGPLSSEPHKRVDQKEVPLEIMAVWGPCSFAKEAPRGQGQVASHTYPLMKQLTKYGGRLSLWQSLEIRWLVLPLNCHLEHSLVDVT